MFRNPFLAALLLLAAACSAPQAARPACPTGKVCLHLGNATEPNSLDPQKSSGVAEDVIVSDLMMGLTQDDAEGRPVPGMAERWDVSSDGLVWTRSEEHTSELQSH